MRKLAAYEGDVEQPRELQVLDEARLAAQQTRVFEAAHARAEAVAASGVPQTERTEARLTRALGSVQALAELYPDLKAAQGFQALQAELAEIEDEIQAARRIYNANVQAYNTRIQQFPTSVLARWLSFRRRCFIELEHAVERGVPQAAF
jgi:LemA protein